jgi:DNA-binding NtrC family response regulator
VDDDPEYAPLLKLHLQRGSHQVSPTAYASAALQLLALKPDGWDIVMSAERVSRIDGVEFIRQVHASYPTLPCVLIAHFIDDRLADAVARVQPCLLLQKPMTVDQVAALVEQASSHCSARHDTPPSPPAS